MNNPRVAALAALTIGCVAVTGPATAQPSAAPAPQGVKSPQSARTITLAPTRPGNYAYWSVTRTGAGSVATLTPDAKTALLALPADAREIHVLNEAEGTLAVLPAVRLQDGATVRVTPEDFRYLRSLVARVTAAGGKPAASAVVTLVDAEGKQAQRVLTVADRGRVEFGNVLRGKATLTATYGGDGQKTTQQVTVAPGVGGAPPEVNLALSGNVPTVAEDARPASDAPAAAPPPAQASPVARERTGSPASQGPSWIAGIVGIALLAGAGYYGLRVLRTRGVTVASALRGMGVEMPQDAQAQVANLAPSRPAPDLPPLPPLSELPAAGPAAVAAGPRTPHPATGPRLVGVAGSAVGVEVPLEAGAITIGRDPGNALALPQDTTVSRRHARVEPLDGGWAVVDEGSSNGTFVNGLRTPGQALEPGDEIQIGSARFRFER